MKKNKILGSTLISFLIIFTLNACNDEDITSHPKDLGEPVKATEITSSSAILECKVWSNSKKITECGFEYTYAYTNDDSLRYADSDWDSDWNSYQHATSSSDIMGGDSTIIVKLEYLPENTLIFCRAYIHADNKYKYGKVMCFRTKTRIILTNTLLATQIKPNKVRLNGSFETDENEDISDCEYGFYISENKEDVEECHSYSKSYSNNRIQNSFYYDKDNLTPNTTYYFRSFISYNRNYVTIEKTGNIESFSTPTIDMNLVTGDAIKTEVSCIELTGTSSPNSEYYPLYGFIISSETYSFSEKDFTDVNSKVMVTYGENDNGTITGNINMVFKQNTTYYYAIWAEVYGKHFIGDVKTFNSGYIDFINVEATNITAHSAILSATYNDLNSDPIYTGFLVSSKTKQPSENDYEFICEIYMYGDNVQKDELNHSVCGLKANTTYYYCPYIDIMSIHVCGEAKSFTTTSETTIEGAVDLGTTVFWATENLGATKGNPIGNYYAWGETTSKETFINDGYTKPNLTNISNSQYDVATATLGKGWRMPTQSELYELYSVCDFKQTVENGVKGTLIISRTTSYSIFVPYSGFKYEDMTTSMEESTFWLSCANSGDLAYCFDNTNIGADNNYFCFGGLPIRPVYDPNLK